DLLYIGEDRLQRAENAFITDVDVGDRRRVLRIGFHVREDADERLVVVLNREAYAGQKKRPAQRGIRIRIDRDRRHRWLCYGRRNVGPVLVVILDLHLDRAQVREQGLFLPGADRECFRESEVAFARRERLQRLEVERIGQARKDTGGVEERAHVRKLG